MKTRENKLPFPAMIPVNDETRAMLDYAASPEGRAKIENARQEIRDGKSILVTPAYFEDLNRRIANRTAQSRKA